MSSDVMPLAKGTRIADRYVIHSVLGKGGMGTVYLATDEKLNHKKRVLKVPNDRYSEQVLIHEAGVLARLNHTMLPELIDVIRLESEYVTMIVMDYIDGETLEQWFMSHRTNVDPSRVMQWAIQLCDCFDYLHEQNPEPVIYRDLKPSNVMIQKNGMIRLIDFGIARYHKDHQLSDTLPYATIGFASPEQLAGQRSDVRSDLYTLGSFMYYLLSGGKHYTSNQEKISRWRSDLPHSLSAFIHKLLEASPDHRYQSAAETKRALNKISDHSAIHLDSKDDNHQQSRLILVGSVSSGSGATMAALALSAELHKQNIFHTLSEYPENKPSLSFLLHRERVEPDRPNQGQHAGADPHCVMDVSDRWESEGVQHLAARADEIWMVADPYPPGFNSVTALKNMELAVRWREIGRAVYFVANRYQKSSHLQDWLKAFPWKPQVKIPAWKPEELYRFYAEGTIRAFPCSEEYGKSMGWSEWVKKLEKRLVIP